MLRKKSGAVSVCYAVVFAVDVIPFLFSCAAVALSSNCVAVANSTDGGLLHERNRVAVALPGSLLRGERRLSFLLLSILLVIFLCRAQFFQHELRRKWLRRAEFHELVREALVQSDASGEMW